MRRFFYVIFGIVLLGVAGAFVMSRLSEEPDLISKYEQKITGEAPAFENAPRTRSAQPSTRSLGGDDSSQELELFQMALDVGNLLVGVIGIYLAFFGGRGRR